MSCPTCGKPLDEYGVENKDDTLYVIEVVTVEDYIRTRIQRNQFCSIPCAARWLAVQARHMENEEAANETEGEGIMQTERCSNCFFYKSDAKDLKEGEGECRRFPPYGPHSEGFENIIIVAADYWCGEFGEIKE